MAPEIVLKQSYDNKVDTWALGILTYCLLSGGKFPYDANNVSQIYWQIKTKQPVFTPFERYHNSDTLIDFMKHCLDKNPLTRHSAEQLL